MLNSTNKCTRVIKSNIGTWDIRVLITDIRKESLNQEFDQLVGCSLETLIHYHQERVRWKP